MTDRGLVCVSVCVTDRGLWCEGQGASVCEISSEL